MTEVANTKSIQKSGIDNDIYVFGPIDRFNYGDLLFAKVLNYSFQLLFPDKYDFHYYGMITHDLTSRGGQKGKGFKDLKKDIGAGIHPALIVAGGESLGATWHSLYIYLDQIYAYLAHNRWINKVLRKTGLIRFFFGSKSEYPFVIDRRDYSKEIKVIYNSPGGIYLEDFELLNSGIRPDYLAVRDKLTQRKLLEKQVQDVNLTPDSAMVLSEFENDDYFENNSNIRPSILEIKNNKYLLFQISEKHAGPYIREIFDQLMTIKNKLKLEIVLCPFSTLPHHHNEKPLLKLKLLSEGKFIYINDPHVDEITFLIKNATVFAGSSLHGIIVSMSYNTPFAGIGIDTLKLRSYTETWALPEMKEIYSPDRFQHQILFLSGTNLNEKMIENLNRQTELYFNSIKSMHRIISEK